MGDNPKGWRPRPSTRTRGTCKVHGCGRLRANDITSYCSAHSSRMYRYGHPEGMDRIANPSDKTCDWIAIQLRTVTGHPAMDAALRLADELLNFRPFRGYGWELKIQEQMTRLRDHGVTPFDVLVRIVECAQYLELRPLRTQRETDYFYARGVLRAAPLHDYRAGGSVLRWLGPLIREQLEKWAHSFLQLVARRDAARRELLAAADFSNTPVTGTRADLQPVATPPADTTTEGVPAHE